MPHVPGAPDDYLWPITATVGESGRLHIADVDVGSLARTFGTPLYIFDEATIRAQCRAYHDAFRSRWPRATVAYAGKAYLSPALCVLLQDEGMELDVVSAGELAVALAAGMPPAHAHLHGNLKPDDELAFALDHGVGRVVVDGQEELERLEAMARERGVAAAIWLRLNPEIAATTHAHIQTGHAASKFGLNLDGELWDVAAKAQRSPWLDLVGLHAHIGSQLFDASPVAEVTRTLARLAAELRGRLGADIRELSPGGGLAVAYTPQDRPPSVEAYAEAITTALRAETARLDLAAPRLIVEPGRSIVARAGVAVYTVGARKQRSDGSVLVAVDGGMGDNPRPALYGAAYHAALVERMDAPADERAQVVGRYCESGDLLAQSVPLPRARYGDLLAVPVSGAYHLPMASNYNGVPRPAVVFVSDGSARLTRRRETLNDLLRVEVGWSMEGAGGDADD